MDSSVPSLKLIFPLIRQKSFEMFRFKSKKISGDHALVDLGCIGHFNPKLITVRSKSRDLLSIDSSAVPIQGSTKLKKQVYSEKIWRWIFG